MMSSGEAICAGRPYARSQGCGACGKFKFDTVNPPDPSLRLRPAPGCAFIANLAARSRRRSRPWRNRRRMIVRLHLQQNMNIFFVISVCRITPAQERTCRRARRESPRHYRDMPRAHSRPTPHWYANHLEQRSRLPRPIDRPACIEYLVAAVFAVGLREHIQLDVGRIAPQLSELRDKILDFIGRKRTVPARNLPRQSPPLPGPARRYARVPSCSLGANSACNSSALSKNTLSVMRSLQAPRPAPGDLLRLRRVKKTMRTTRARSIRSIAPKPVCAECRSPCSTTATAYPRVALSTRVAPQPSPRQRPSNSASRW